MLNLGETDEVTPTWSPSRSPPWSTRSARFARGSTSASSTRSSPTGSSESDVRVERGVTRTVLLVGRWAINLPRATRSGHGVLWSLAHGVLANLSERHWSGWDGVCPVRWSLAGLVNVYPRCQPAALPPGFDYIASPGPGDGTTLASPEPSSRATGSPSRCFAVPDQRVPSVTACWSNRALARRAS